MADTGWISATTATNGGGGDVSWSNPGNVASSNNARASATYGPFQSSLFTDTLLVQFGTGLSANIPAEATIDGVEVGVEGYDSASVSQGFSASLYDTVAAASVGGTEAIGASLPVGSSSAEAYITFGGSSSLWQGAPTRDELVASSFRVVLGGASTSNDVTTYIDHVRIKVYYTYTPPPEDEKANSILFWGL